MGKPHFGRKNVARFEICPENRNRATKFVGSFRGSLFLAGSRGMVSAMGLVFGRWGKRLSGVRRVCRSRSWREIAFENGWIMRDQLMESAERYGKSPYGQHLKGIADGEIMLVPNQKS